MIDLSNYSCDKCSREFSRYCKRCFHTRDKVPTKFKRKKITGCQTPEYRCPTMPPVKPTKPNSNYVPSASVKSICPYITPCGWCSKCDKKCNKKIGCNTNTKLINDPSDANEIKSVDIIFGYEHCVVCNDYEQCVNYIINRSDLEVKCIHFGLLRERIKEIMKQEN